jgi:hypothetical protein
MKPRPIYVKGSENDSISELTSFGNRKSTRLLNNVLKFKLCTLLFFFIWQPNFYSNPKNIHKKWKTQNSSRVSEM